MEHRWGQRVAIDLPLRIACFPFGNGTGRWVNASISGALIETDLTLPLLSQVTMEIALPRHARRGCIKLPGAYVVRKTPEGYGLEWQDLISAEFLAISWRVGSTVSQSGGHTRCQ